MKARGWRYAGGLIDQLARKRVLFRPRDVEALGVSRTWARLMVKVGGLEEVAPAVYSRWREEFSAVAIAATKFPRGVACLTTALQLHGWAEVNVPELWWAIPRSVRKPKNPPVPMRFLRLRPASFERDIEVHRIDGVNVRVYSLQRTLADCLRFGDRLATADHSEWWPRLLSEADRSLLERRLVASGDDHAAEGGPRA